MNDPITILITDLDGNPPKHTWQELENLVKAGTVVHLCAARGTRLLTGDRHNTPWPWKRADGYSYPTACAFFGSAGDVDTRR
jgi:hypothetical protein